MTKGGQEGNDPQLTGVGLDHWGDAFPSTHWSIVFQGPGEESATRRMLERLCGRYWYPMYAYLRKRGYSSHDAQDFTQGFFAKLLEGDGLAGADRGRGKFRSYMIGAMKHYLSQQRERASAQKRGGGSRILSIDQELAEKRFLNEPVDDLSPERLFDREWALALLQEVFERLETEYRQAGKREVFETLGEFVTSTPEKGTYPVLAEKLGMNAAHVRVLVSRIRKRYQELLRETIADTVGSSEEIENELQFLREAF